MKQVITLVLILVASTSSGLAKSKVVCGRNMSATERLYCQYQQNRAPEYYTGCFDIYAQLEGIEEAKNVCAGAYEDHKEYVKTKKGK